MSLVCLTICNPNSTPDIPVHHQPPELTQTQLYRVGNAIQPSHSLSSVSPPSFNLSHNQGLFQGVSIFCLFFFLRLVAKVLELQHHSFQLIFSPDFPYDCLVGSPGCLMDSEESSPTPQFKGINFLMLSFFLYSNSHIHM